MADEIVSNPAPTPAPQVPYPLAIIICDGMHIDPATPKKTILGTFTAYQSSEFPFRIPQIIMYLALSDGRGTVPFQVKLVRVDNDEIDNDSDIFSTEGQIEFSDPLAVYEL